MKPNCYLHALSSHVPAEVLTNDDLSKLVETNDEWITTRTGDVYKRQPLARPHPQLDHQLRAGRLAFRWLPVMPDGMSTCCAAPMAPCTAA